MKENKSEIGDKYRIAVKMKASLTEGGETTSLDLDLDISVEELDVERFAGAVRQVLHNGNGVRRDKAPVKP